MRVGLWAVGISLWIAGVQAMATSELDNALRNMRLISVNVTSRTSVDGQVERVEPALSEEDCLEISRRQTDLVGAKLIEFDVTMDQGQRDFYSRTLDMDFVSRRIQYCLGEIQKSN